MYMECTSKYNVQICKLYLNFDTHVKLKVIVLKSCKVMFTYIGKAYINLKYVLIFIYKKKIIPYQCLVLG